MFQIVVTMVVHIMSNGAYLHLKDGLFEVLTPTPTDGKTHTSHQYAVSHVKSFWIHSLASLSTAALRLAIEQDIDIVLCDWRGMPIGRFSPHRPSTTALVQKAQLIISQTAHAVTYVKSWIVQKLDNQIDFLKEIANKRKEEAQKNLKTAIKKIKDIRDKIKTLEGKHISEIAEILRGMEGAACKIYFAALNGALPKYYQFDGRTRQPANDLFNAFLNYGYAILYNRVEIAVTTAGLSPHIGFLHRDGFGAFRSFVYDVIEPFRVEVDKIVFKLFSGKSVSYEQHGMASDTEAEGIWLSENGRKLIAARFTDTYDAWQNRLATFTRHISSTLRKQLTENEGENSTALPDHAIQFFG
jgi:CRISP-associated protein Cas1